MHRHEVSYARSLIGRTGETWCWPTSCRSATQRTLSVHH